MITSVLSVCPEWEGQTALGSKTMTEASTEIRGHAEKKRPESPSYSAINASVVSPVCHVTYDYMGFQPVFPKRRFYWQQNVC